MMRAAAVSSDEHHVDDFNHKTALFFRFTPLSILITDRAPVLSIGRVTGAMKVNTEFDSVLPPLTYWMVKLHPKLFNRARKHFVSPGPSHMHNIINGSKKKYIFSHYELVNLLALIIRNSETQNKLKIFLGILGIVSPAPHSHKS